LKAGRIDPRIVDVDQCMVAFEFPHQVDNSGVADVGTVLFERQPEYEYVRINDVDLALCHQTNDPVHHVFAHRVVDASAGENHLRVVTNLLRFERQVVRIDPDAMAAHQSRIKILEIPFCSRRRQNIPRINIELLEDRRQLVHESNIEIALGILDHFSSLGDFDRRRTMDARRDD
jgi:hypothetical protein